MLNKEKYAKEIIEVVVGNNGNGVCVKNGKPACCGEIGCEKCDICDNCIDGFTEWANSEYNEPEIDWRKVPVDTPIYVRDNIVDEWRKAHFAKFRNGQIYVWAAGCTSWTIGDHAVVCWEYGKLAEEVQ